MPIPPSLSHCLSQELTHYGAGAEELHADETNYWPLREKATSSPSFDPFGAYLDQMMDNNQISPDIALTCLDIVTFKEEEPICAYHIRRNPAKELESAITKMGLDSVTGNEIVAAYNFYNESMCYGGKDFPTSIEEKPAVKTLRHLLQICTGNSEAHFDSTRYYTREQSPRLPSCLRLTPLQMRQAEYAHLNSRNMKEYIVQLLEHSMEPQTLYQHLLLYKLSREEETLKEACTTEEAQKTFGKTLKSLMYRGPEALKSYETGGKLIDALKDFEEELAESRAFLLPRYEQKFGVIFGNRNAAMKEQRYLELEKFLNEQDKTLTQCP